MIGEENCGSRCTMSQFVSRIEEHPFRSYSDNLFSRLEESRELVGLSEHEFDTINRIEAVYKIIQNRIYSVDPILLSKNVLDGIGNNTNTIDTQLTAVIQNHNNNNVSQKTVHIKRINEVLDSVTIQITQIFQPLVPNEVEALKDSIVSTRHSLSQHNRYIKEEYEEFSMAKQRVEHKITELSNKLTVVEENVENTVDNCRDQLKDFERMFSEKQQERTEDFSNFQIECKETFNEELNVMKEAFSTKIKEVEEEFLNYKAQIESRMDQHNSDVQVAKDELYQLIEVAGNDVMSDGYAKYANNAARSKLIWQIVSVLCLLGLVGAAYSIIPSLEGETFSWSTLSARSLLTLSIGSLSAFTIRQAHLSHLEEYRNREMQLKLGSIEPYLKNFEPEKRNQIKETLVVDYFSRYSSAKNTVINQNEQCSTQQQGKQTTA